MPATQKKKRHYTADRADVRKKADVQQPRIIKKNADGQANKANNIPGESGNGAAIGESAVQLLPLAIVAAAVYILICFLMNDSKDNVGGIGVFIRNAFYGLFADVAVIIPFMIGCSAFILEKDLKTGYLKYRAIFSVVCLTLFSSVTHLFTAERGNGGFSIAAMFENGKNHIGGGAVGGTLTEILIKCVGSIGTGIIIIPLSVISVILLIGFTPLDLVKIAAAFVRDYKNSGYYKSDRTAPISRKKEKIPKAYNKIQNNAQNNIQNNVRNEVQNKVRDEVREKIQDEVHDKIRNKNIDTGTAPSVKNKTDTAITDTENIVLENAADIPDNTGKTERVRKISRKDKKKQKPEENAEPPKVITTPVFIPEKSLFEFTTGSGADGIKHNEPDAIADNIFADITDDEDIIKTGINAEKTDRTGRTDRTGEDIPVIEKSVPFKREDEPDIEFETSRVFAKYKDDLAKAEYKFPPISYLTRDTGRANIDVSGELSATAARLVETLGSFGVKATISAISRGPSITRYELTPNAGVKVRSIVNLVDDIALNLAASGVRMEVPIPGKAAVGVEVPNKTVSTVHLRTLLEESQFMQAAGKITVALGMDVAGNPIYSDIAKMPHLLIAGATGMGKSVCINSIIASILYKAKPSEVKLMLIDPKKVELNIYNGIPHLLVPVVSDPAKAAGSLNWAVSEMENRFKLIEERGVRDIKSYNDIISRDPLAERLPQIVIVIDELADLMMTAPGDVEQSICRLAQKARAAGMHLIIGTQRPSVDVITGLIKANIPSRIAFTVASQIDSRTIIDTGGADKLIGRGDMLYLPVGASKPIRVQGAYVSEKDILNVTEFLKKQANGEYSEHILNAIEQEAQNCETKVANTNKRK